MKQEKTIVIDATNAILGRLASFVAKQTLYGNKVVVVNSEKAAIKGTKKSILEKYAIKLFLGGASQKGPYFTRKAEALLRRAIRGMLPYEKTRGREALKNVKCYSAIPKEFESLHKVIFGGKKPSNSITLGELIKLIK